MNSSALHPKLPKYVRVAEELRSHIGSGAWRRGDKLPRVSELQKQFGVSLDTLDKVLGLLETEGTITRTQGSGVYVADANSRLLHKGAIGFVMGESEARHPYWSQLLEGVQDAAHREGTEIVLLNPNGGPMPWDKVDGIIGSGLSIPSLLSRAPAKLPCVALLQRTAEIPTVIADEALGIRAAVDYLIGLGHRHIAYLFGGYPELRLSAYYDALKENGITPGAAWVRRLDLRSHARFADMSRDAMRAWLAEDWSNTGCTALLCHNDETAFGALEILREAKIHVPNDVSVVGFDGTELCEMVSPRLTTVEVPLWEVGAKGVEMLLQQIRQDVGEAAQLLQTIALPVRLRVGESSGRLKI